MPITRTEVVRDVSTANVSTKTYPITSAVPAGHTLIVTGNVPTPNALTTITVTDEKGNTYDVVKELTSKGAAKAPFIASTVVEHALAIGDEITVTLNVLSSQWMILAADYGPIGPLDRSNHVDVTTVGDPSISLGGAARENHQLVVAAFVNTNTTHVFAPGTGYTEVTNLTSGTGSSTVNLHVEWREYNASGTRVADGTYNTDAAYSAVAKSFAADPEKSSINILNEVLVPAVKRLWTGSAWSSV